MAHKQVLIIFPLLLLLLLTSSSIVISAAAHAHAHAHPQVLTDHTACPFDRIYSFGSSSNHHPSSHRLASKFHLPLPQPYTDIATTAHVYGASFSTPNSTVMPRWFFLENGIQPPAAPFNQSLLKQLVSFENLLSPYCFSHDRCLQKLNKALFLFDQLGVNDYQHMLFHGKSIPEVSKLVPQVVEAIKGKLEGLIRFGAQNLFVSGSPPIGCFHTKFLRGSSEEGEFHYDSNKCGKELNMFATLHNDHLQQALYELRHKYPHVRAVYMDYYKLGFDHTRRRNGREAMGFNVSKRLMKVCGGTHFTPCTHQDHQQDHQQDHDHYNPAKAKQCGVVGRSTSCVASVCKATGLGDINSRGDSFGLTNKAAAAARIIFNPLDLAIHVN